MSRILAIDYGTKRVGIAVTDPLQIVANALVTVHAKDLLDFLADYFGREPVQTVVVGYPLQNDGTDSSNAQHVKGFLKHFRKRFPEMPVVLADERFTSKLAFQAMIDGGLGKMARRDKATVDRISATIILQSYMERRANGFA